MIDFIKVSKKYSDEYGFVFEDFDLHIDRGEIVAIIGESGIGKTTLINLLLRESEVTSGEIIVDGKKLSKLSHRKVPYYRRELGVIFQDFKLIPELTAYENVKAAMVGAGGWNTKGYKRISSIFSMLGITSLHNKKPLELSGGEQQKVCMARAIVNYPRILLADEPTKNLDPDSSMEIFKLLQLINLQGITVVLSTHDYDCLKEMKWRTINLNESKAFANALRHRAFTYAKEWRE